jgi:YcxB-like protein
MEEIVAEYVWTVDELVTARKWHVRQGILRYVRVLVWGLIVFFLGLGLLTLIVLRDAAGITGIVIGLFLLFIHLIVDPWLIRRQFDKRPDQGIAVEWRFLPDLILIENALGKSEVQWDAFYEVVQSPDGFLFCANKQIFHWLPRHAFARDDDFTQLLRLAEQKARKFRQIS